MALNMALTMALNMALNMAPLARPRRVVPAHRENWLEVGVPVPARRQYGRGRSPLA